MKSRHTQDRAIGAASIRRPAQSLAAVLRSRPHACGALYRVLRFAKETIVKQPFLGILATILVMALSLGLISLFDFPTFAGWMSYGLMCLIPMQIVIGVTWGTNQPGFAAKQRQPLKGLLLMLTTALIGAVVVP